MATLVLHPETSNSQRVHLEKPSLLIGSASDADVCLESELVSDHHARVEQKPDGYYLISLTNPPRVFVNDVEVTFQRLESGDAVTFGDVKAEFLLTDGEEAVVEEMPRDATFPAGTTALVESPQNFRNCPQCGMVLALGAQACPQCGFSMANLPAIPMNFVPPTPAGQAGPGMLPVIALLAALTVVGAPVALALGLMTLSIIRQRGGTLRDRSLGRWSIGLSLMWLMLGGVVAGSLVWQEREREQLNVVEVTRQR